MTGIQNAILGAIKRMTEARGYPPTVREIGEAVGLASTSSVKAHLDTLYREGYITWEPKSPRTIRITP